MSDSERSVDGDFSILLDFDCRLLLFLFQVVIFDQNRIFSVLRNKQPGLQFSIYRWVIQLLGTIRNKLSEVSSFDLADFYTTEVLFLVFEEKKTFPTHPTLVRTFWKAPLNRVDA